MSEFKWYINEDGGVYPYNPDEQAEDFPGDYPTPYDTVNEAWEAAKTLMPWNGPEDDDEEDEYPYSHQSQSGAEFMADYYNSDSYIAYLNG